MPRFASRACRLGGILSVLCIGAVPLSFAASHTGPFPNPLAPNPSVAWMTGSSGFSPPASGAGPVGQDPAYPRVSNEEFRDTGRQATFPMADLNSPILQPWAKEELRKRNALV